MAEIKTSSVPPELENALAARGTFIDARHEHGFRLFNGFTEGRPELVIDIYGQTLVIYNYSDDPSQNQALINDIQEHLRHKLTWLQAGILKTRNGKSQEEKRGRIVFGEKPDRKVKENGVWYAIDLMMNRDASLYLDTRNLRKWLVDNSKDKTVLNTFAYTGSLGVAAMAGGASRVVHLDLNRRFLNLAKESYTLNGFPIHKSDFIASDFFPAVGRFKRSGDTFDCVLIDPPFFSTTSKGRVDQENENSRLINKVRPLITDGGHLIAINNALYTSGKDYLNTLEELCKDGYLKIRELIPVPEDYTGYPETEKGIPSPIHHRSIIPPRSPSSK